MPPGPGEVRTFGKQQQGLAASQRRGEIVDLLTCAIAAGQEAQASPLPCEVEHRLVAQNGFEHDAHLQPVGEHEKPGHQHGIAWATMPGQHDHRLVAGNAFRAGARRVEHHLDIEELPGGDVGRREQILHEPIAVDVDDGKLHQRA